MITVKGKYEQQWHSIFTVKVVKILELNLAQKDRARFNDSNNP